MTKKENLYFELLKVQEEVSMRKYNRSYKAIALDEYVNSDKFRKDADRLTVAKIEEDTRVWQKQLNELNAKDAVAAWLETEDGKAYVEQRKNRMEEIRQTRHNILDTKRADVSKAVKSLLGEQWDVTSFGSTTMEISIVEKYLEDGTPIRLFGHGFDIYYSKNWHDENYLWEMNYGTMGSFDLNDSNNTRIEFLVGAAKFASDQNMVPALRDSLHDMVRELETLDREYWKLEKEVKEPKMAA
jgi:hypothetical protein